MTSLATSPRLPLLPGTRVLVVEDQLSKTGRSRRICADVVAREASFAGIPGFLTEGGWWRALGREGESWHRVGGGT